MARSLLLCTSATAESLIRFRLIPLEPLVQGSTLETALVVDTFTPMDATKQQQRDALRQHIRAKRRSLSNAQLSTAASQLQPKVLSALHDINANFPLKRVAGYLAFQGEIDVNPVMDTLRIQGVQTYVPMLTGETLKFAAWSTNTSYTQNRFGIIEPKVPESEWIDANDLDAVLVPLVAFDKLGNRLGMGGGFYDKTFSHRQSKPAPPWLIGVGHALQQVDDVFEDWWDVKLDQTISA